jgi:outer membrane lipoprotein LolB
MSPAVSRRAAVRVLGLASLALLGACATRTPAVSRPEESRWTGRFSLTVQSDPPQSWSAGFELSGSAAAGELHLNSPLGNHLAAVRWAPGEARLQQGERLTKHPSLDSLTAELGGTALPVAALFDWLRGRQAPVSGWEADLSRQPEGRIVARRLQPLPAAELRLILEP